MDRPWQHYTVIGAGKTGLDALLYLLQQVWRAFINQFCQKFFFPFDDHASIVWSCQLFCFYHVHLFCGQGVKPETIQWIVPNDCWYLNRDAIVKDGGMQVANISGTRKLAKVKIIVRRLAQRQKEKTTYISVEEDFKTQTKMLDCMGDWVIISDQTNS